MSLLFIIKGEPRENLTQVLRLQTYGYTKKISLTETMSDDTTTLNESIGKIRHRSYVGLRISIEDPHRQNDGEISKQNIACAVLSLSVS